MFTTRPEIAGTFGVVATTHWIASQVGMAVLERGGNAFDAAVAAGGDTGQPVAAGDSSTAQLFAELADRIAREIAPVLDAGGCSARMLANLDAAVGASKA